MSGVRSNLQLAAVFVVGLGAGIWTVVMPWVIPYPTAGGAWTSSTWAAVWVGAAVAAASGIGLVVSLALATAEATRASRADANAEDMRR